MKKFVKIILTVAIVILISPAVVLAGSVAVSLTRGHSIQESIQILASQIDALSGRVNRVETKVSEINNKVSDTETKLSKAEACQRADHLYITLPPMQKDPATGQIIGRAMASNIVDEYTAENEMYQDAVKQNNIMEFGDPKVLAIDLNIIKQYYDAYTVAKADCGNGN